MNSEDRNKYLEDKNKYLLNEIDTLEDNIETLVNKVNNLEDELDYCKNKEFDLDNFIYHYYDDLKELKYSDKGLNIGDFEHKKIYIYLK